MERFENGGPIGLWQWLDQVGVLFTIPDGVPKEWVEDGPWDI